MVDGQKDPCQWETPLVVNGYVDVYVFKCLAFLVCRGNSKTKVALIWDFIEPKMTAYNKK